MAKLVRLKPHDPKKGHVIRRYTAFAVRFEEARGWYKVSDEVAAYLSTVHQRPSDEDSPLAFDVLLGGGRRSGRGGGEEKAEERARAARAECRHPLRTSRRVRRPHHRRLAGLAYNAIRNQSRAPA